MANKNYISTKLYKYILQNMPIVAVDLIVLTGSGFLMVKRKNEPVKNGWWLPGGRVKHGESLPNAVLRKAWEELGMRVQIIKQTGVYDLRFPRGAFGIKNLHNFDFVFMVKPIKKWTGLSVNSTSGDYSEWKNFKAIDPNWNRQLIAILKDAGFKVTGRK